MMITLNDLGYEAAYAKAMLADAALIRTDHRRAKPAWRPSDSQRRHQTEVAVKLRDDRSAEIAAFLAANGPCMRPMIVDALGIDRGIVYAVLKHMQSRGIITEKRVGQNGAAVWSLATPNAEVTI